MTGRGFPRGVIADDLTEAESLLMVAESLLPLLESAGSEGLTEVLHGQGPQAEEALAAALASGHPDRRGIAEPKAVAERTLRKPGSRNGHARPQHKNRKEGGRRH